MKWNVSVGLHLSIDYDDIEADTREEAEEIAKLSLEEKVDYLDAIFHVGVSKEKLDNICTENKEQINSK